MAEDTRDPFSVASCDIE